MITLKRNWLVFGLGLGIASVAGVATINVLADPPQPVLSIASLGGNQFNIVITNAVTTNYTLLWTPALANQNYPWEVLGVGVNRR